ncbi:hypothetical protein M5X04_04250 [Paenibacillus alvei]|uniref:Uncharacterized protein n=2 Tax=Paenibacillus TaxID=44249 RepID=A0ABT4E4A1_PAEAL|nr:hypothetical protein [Paenibacillus alvei]MCY9528547.1 hypothetical protein [Paenibacillus alvei]
MYIEMKSQTEGITESIKHFQKGNWRLLDHGEEQYLIDLPELPDVDQTVFTIEKLRFNYHFNTVTIELRKVHDMIVLMEIQTDGLELQQYLEEVIGLPMKLQEQFSFDIPCDNDKFPMLVLDTIANLSTEV